MENQKEENKSWLDKKLGDLNGFKGALFGPFLICFKHPADFFIWAMFIIFAGQLGTIINLVNKYIFGEFGFAETLYHDSAIGSFYTYALVLIASLIGPLFSRLRNKETPMFSSISMIFSTILIFAMILCAVFFSSSSQNVPFFDHNKMKELQYTVDIKQLIFFLLSIIFAWYAYGFSLMAKNKELLQLDEDSYAQLQDKKIKKESNNINQTNTDGEGVAI